MKYSDDSDTGLKDRDRRGVSMSYSSGGALVEDGWAWNFVKYSKSNRLGELEKNARESKKGLWAGKTLIAPWEYRAEEARKRAKKSAKI